MGNGFFIHRADDVVTYSREEGGVFLPLADNPHGLPFGSTGGGLQYVVDWGGCVHRSTTASVEGDFETVAPSLQQFLDRLRDAVVTFTETGAVVDVWLRPPDEVNGDLVSRLPRRRSSSAPVW